MLKACPVKDKDKLQTGIRWLIQKHLDLEVERIYKSLGKSYDYGWEEEAKKSEKDFQKKAKKS